MTMMLCDVDCFWRILVLWDKTVCVAQCPQRHGAHQKGAAVHPKAEGAIQKSLIVIIELDANSMQTRLQKTSCIS